jgi:hypothetical protein
MNEAVGVIVAAIIAGWVAFFSLIISKEQSVSEFRQQWIDELRKDIAAVVASVTGMHGASITERKDGLGQPWERLKAELIVFTELVARIRLRLNPNEKREIEGPATKAVLAALKELESIFASPEPQFHKLHPLVTTLVTESQLILKENWRRVEVGEPTYRFSKMLTLVVAVVAFIALLLRMFKVI